MDEGVDESLNQAIEDVAPEIDGRFPGKPDVAASVHYTIAQNLDNAAQYDSAGQQYDAAAADWIKASGPRSQDAIFAQLQHVFLDARSQRVGSLDKAKALFTQEKERIDELRRPEPRVLFGSQDAEGMIALASGDVKGAESKFQSAADIADKYPAISREIRLSAKQRLCSVQLRAGDALNAELCFRNLRAEIASSEGPEDGNLLLFDFGIAQALLFETKFDDAIHQVDAIYPRFVKQFGADNARTLQLLGVRAEAEGNSEKWDDSIRDDLTLVDVAKKTDPTGFMAVGALSDAALSECRSGKYVAGEAHARADLKTASAPGQNVGMKGVVEYSEAMCIILPQLNGSPAPSRLDEAESLLRDINIELVSALTANPGWGANIDLARAQIAFLRKNYAAASDYLAKAKPGFNSPKAEVYQRQTIAKLESEIERATTKK